mmetsp:Transcript_16728/g.31294  ORF Transcript_16728/g.31294 Transcript_16728/m.31294 type:complete len:209 (-) Transcript_16728:351-977(-)
MRSPNFGLVQDTQVIFRRSWPSEKDCDGRRFVLTCESGRMVVSQQFGLRVSSIGTENKGSSIICRKSNAIKFADPRSSSTSTSFFSCNPSQSVAEISRRALTRKGFSTPKDIEFFSMFASPAIGSKSSRGEPKLSRCASFASRISTLTRASSPAMATVVFQFRMLPSSMTASVLVKSFVKASLIAVFMSGTPSLLSERKRSFICETIV